MAVNTIVFIITIILAVIFAILAVVGFILWQIAIGDCENNTTKCPVVRQPPEGQCLCVSDTCPCPSP